MSSVRNYSDDTAVIPQVIMVRFNIALPDAMKAELQAEAEQRKTTSSALIAECVTEHYTGTSKAEYEEQLQALKQECTASQHKLQAEHEAQLQECKRENAILWHKVDLFKQDTVENADSHAAVVRGLQHELELSEANRKNLSDQLMLHKDTIQALERDKEELQKQLELVALRPPSRRKHM
ncbi:MAG: hypothetical protein ACXV5D_07810 [Halobacteriota archaeon]